MADQLVLERNDVLLNPPQSRVATEEVLSYIDSINSPRRVNPLELAPQLQDAFAFSEREARAYLVLWLRLFSKRYIQRKEAAKKQAIRKN